MCTCQLLEICWAIAFFLLVRTLFCHFLKYFAFFVLTFRYSSKKGRKSVFHGPILKKYDFSTRLKEPACAAMIIFFFLAQESHL
jgi:hypothetical protein